MPTFDICGTVTVSCWTKVKAKTKDEALAIAAQREMAAIHIDGTASVEEVWHLDSDGMASELRIDE